MFELTNEQRKYFGLDPIGHSWERARLKGDSYRAESMLYFEGDTIKRHIFSTADLYREVQYNEVTKERAFLTPKTSKGKEQKLSASVLESRQPIGVYIELDKFGNLYIGNHTSQRTFYSSRWEFPTRVEPKNLDQWVEDFILEAPPHHLEEIETFRKSTRRNNKFRAGDFFSFKLSRTEFGFGRVLLHIDKIRKKNLIPQEHGLRLLMGPPVLIKLYAFISNSEKVSLDELKKTPCLPSDYIMDNALFYGDYNVIGHAKLEDDDFDFPMSFGRSLNAGSKTIFLQWGLIHLQKPMKATEKFLVGENILLPLGNPSRSIQNPYGYYGIGFRPRYDTVDIKDTIANNGKYDFEGHPKFMTQFDLRNPSNKDVRMEIMSSFDLDPELGYEENRVKTNTISVHDLLAMLQKG